MNDLEPGSVRHTVLVYAVSEPGQWTSESIAGDLPEIAATEIGRAVDWLVTQGLVHVNSFDLRLWPLRMGRQAIAAAV